ncbi:MAG: sporulation initiation factor Spo0A C-terminal domain-containing protein [Eubacteriales bacterium]
MRLEEYMRFQLERFVTRIMIELGVPAHLRGYHYLRDAIVRAIENMELVGSVTKLLYPETAKRYHTSEQKVERAIRNAVEVSWMRGSCEEFEEIFGYSRESGKGRPTNSEYIAKIADKVRLDFKL